MLSGKTLLLGSLVSMSAAAWVLQNSFAVTDGPVKPTHQNRNFASQESSSGIPPRLSPGLSRAIPVAAPAESQDPTEGTAAVKRIEAFTEPYREIAVAASEMGTLSEIKVREGEFVSKGDVLAVMQDEVLQASLAVARRNSTVQGALQSAAAELDLKQTELAKLNQLRERSHASAQEVSRIQTELKIAEARHLSVREELEIKHLELKRIEAQIEQRIVRAPMDGIITEVLKDSGEYVSPSDPVIVRLVQLDPLLIVFSVPLARRNELASQQTVSVRVGGQAEPVEGTVEYISPTPDSSNSAVRVKVRLGNSEHRFQSGQTAELLMPETATGSSDIPEATAVSSPAGLLPVANGSHETTVLQ